MRTALVVLVLLVAACGDDSGPSVSDGPESYGVPADRVDDVEEVTTPEGVIYRVDDTLYGPCAVLEPQGTVGVRLGLTPEGGFAVVCRN